MREGESRVHWSSWGALNWLLVWQVKNACHRLQVQVAVLWYINNIPKFLLALVTKRKKKTARLSYLSMDQWPALVTCDLKVWHIHVFVHSRIQSAFTPPPLRRGGKRTRRRWDGRKEIPRFSFLPCRRSFSMFLRYWILPVRASGKERGAPRDPGNHWP